MVSALPSPRVCSRPTAARRVPRTHPTVEASRWNSACPPEVSRRVVRENLRYALRHLHPGLNVQELIRTVRIRVRTQDAGHHELRFRKALAEHAHERDAATG